MRSHRLTIVERECPVYQKIIETGSVLDKQNNPVPISSILDVRNAAQLYTAILEYRPKSVLEIGLGYGGSAMAICTALSKLPNKRRLTSIDVYQKEIFNNLGLQNIIRSKLTPYHSLIQEFDYLALPELLAKNKKYDFAYIDGWHTFDYTLLDFFYIDKMLGINGVVGFNDCQIKGVSKVIDFLLSHREYQEITNEITFKLSEKAKETFFKDTAKNILFDLQVDRYFQKIGTEEPTWDFYADF